MEVFIAALLLLLLYLQRSAREKAEATAAELDHKVSHLLEETTQLKRALSELQSGNPTQPAEERAKPISRPVPPVTPVHDPVPQPATEPEPEPGALLSKQPLPAPPTGDVELAPPPEAWHRRWLRDNPDLEKFIGENLVNKIGIAVLVLGIAFFVKYAIDQQWINEVGRVSIGIMSGAVLVGLAHYLRTNYRSFSSVLAGGGIAVFYFTIAFAFHQYGLLSQSVAFAIMVVITGFAVLLSVLYNKPELAVIAAIGGFITPFLVSTGQGSYVVLFTYLLILNAGLLALSSFKRWPLINIISLLFTELIVGGWLVATLMKETSTVNYLLALLFISFLYLLFLGMNMVHQIRHQQKFKAIDFSILLLLNASYFAAGMLLLDRVEGGRYQGLFTLGVGMINCALAWYFFKRQRADRNLVYLLIGLTLTFLSLTIPVQLEGHAITLFWCAETVLLLWLYQRSRIPLFFYSSLLVALLSLVSLVLDWSAVATREPLMLIFTGLRGIVTNVVAALSFGAYAFLLGKDHGGLPASVGLTRLRRAAQILSISLAWLTGIFLVNLFFREAGDYDVPNVYHRLFTIVTLLVLLAAHRARESQPFVRVWLILAGSYALAHLGSFPLVEGLRNGVLTGGYTRIHGVLHVVSVAAALYLFYRAVRLMQEFAAFRSSGFTWLAAVLVIIFLSQEGLHAYVASMWNGAANVLEDQYARAVLTIVWALCSFGLMWLGMRYKAKPLRIISLSLFTLALLKLFLLDIANLSEGWKILAFILLGVLLLTISFMYQKLKNLIIDSGKE